MCFLAWLRDTRAPHRVFLSLLFQRRGSITGPKERERENEREGKGISYVREREQNTRMNPNAGHYMPRWK